jgi:hypothetical protein
MPAEGESRFVEVIFYQTTHCHNQEDSNHQGLFHNHNHHRHHFCSKNHNSWTLRGMPLFVKFWLGRERDQL